MFKLIAQLCNLGLDANRTGCVGFVAKEHESERGSDELCVGTLGFFGLHHGVVTIVAANQHGQRVINTAINTPLEKSNFFTFSCKLNVSKSTADDQR